MQKLFWYMALVSSYLQAFLIRKYKPKNISALPTFIAPIPAKMIAATRVKGIVFISHAHLGRQVLPFATVTSKGTLTINTPVLHMAVVTMDSKKKDSIISWACWVAPNLTKYQTIVVIETCITAPATQVRSVPTKTTLDAFFATGFRN